MAMPYSTIKLFAGYTTMRRCQGMTKSLGQAYSIQTFDQQLYAIAKQVEWAKQDTFKTHILRLGSKKADSHSEDKASYTNVNARTALLNCLPVIIWSTDPAAYTEDSINRSFNPLSPQSLPIDATVYTTMRRCQGMTKSLGQAYSIQTFDQQLYAIAKQVEWAKQDTFKTGDNLSLRTVKISFSLHHSKKADSHSEDKTSDTNVNARTALLNCLPVIICLQK
jgi:hypothetical protein